MSNDLSSKLTDSRYNQQSRGMSFVTNSDQRGTTAYVTQQHREHHAHGGTVGDMMREQAGMGSNRPMSQHLLKAMAEKKAREGQKTELAHLNPKEMAFLKANPGLVQDVTSKYKSIAKKGQGGDTKLGRVSKKTAKALDQIIHHGHKQINERTGLREYPPKNKRCFAHYEDKKGEDADEMVDPKDCDRCTANSNIQIPLNKNFELEEFNKIPNYGDRREPQRKGSCASHVVRDVIEDAIRKKPKINGHTFYPLERYNKFKDPKLSGKKTRTDLHSDVVNKNPYDSEKKLPARGFDVKKLLNKEGFISENIQGKNIAKTTEAIQNELQNGNSVMVAGKRFYSNEKGQKEAEYNNALDEYNKKCKESLFYSCMNKKPVPPSGHVVNLKNMSPGRTHITIRDSNMGYDSRGSISSNGTVSAPFYGQNFLNEYDKNPYHEAKKEPILTLGADNEILAINHKKSAAHRWKKDNKNDFDKLTNNPFEK